MTIMYSECVSAALVIQHAQRMCRILLSSVVCPAVQYFSILYRKWPNFRKKKMLCVLILILCKFLRNISHSRKNMARCYRMYIDIHVQEPLLFSDFN